MLGSKVVSLDRDVAFDNGSGHVLRRNGGDRGHGDGEENRGDDLLSSEHCDDCLCLTSVVVRVSEGC